MNLEQCSTCRRWIDGTCSRCGLPERTAQDAEQLALRDHAEVEARRNRAQLEEGGWTFRRDEGRWVATNRRRRVALSRPSLEMLTTAILSGEYVR